MKSRMSTIAVALIAVGAATSASAADLGRGSIKDTYIPPDVYAKPFTWTGFYVGLQTGYVFGDTDQSFTDGTILGSADTSGWVYGGHVGYNWQMNSFVFGLEADIEGGGVGGSHSNAAGTVFASTDMDWQGSLRARMGLAADRTLFYVTAGWAFAHANTDAFTPTAAGSFSSDLDGWTVGAGIEYAVSSNFTIRGEYRYTDFGSVTGNLSGGVNMPLDLQTSAVRVGASWKF